MVAPSCAGVARFLHAAHGKVPAHVVGKYLTQPPDGDEESRKARARGLTTHFLAQFDFADATPVQALRQVLRHTRCPPGTKRCVCGWSAGEKHLQAVVVDAFLCTSAYSTTALGASMRSLPLPSVRACSASWLFKRIAARYVECHRGVQAGDSAIVWESYEGTLGTFTYNGSGGDPANISWAVSPLAAVRRGAACEGRAAGGAGAAASTGAAVAPLSPARPSPPVRHIVHGLDVCGLDADTVFVIIYSAIILNSDMRSPAVKQKMGRDVFIAHNSCVPGLAGLPPSFFGGVYDEIAVQGLPMTDDVPMGPANLHGGSGTTSRERAPSPEAVAVLDRLTAAGSASRRGLGLPVAAPRQAAAALLAHTASTAETALQRASSWVRSLSSLAGLASWTAPAAAGTGRLSPASEQEAPGQQQAAAPANDGGHD
jgi:hypothetical protein